MILSLLPNNTPNKETYIGTANMAAHSLFQILTLFYIFLVCFLQHICAADTAPPIYWQLQC
jgi:hypothetical protein